MPNIELKAHCENLDRARETALRCSTKNLGVLRQTDTYFRTKSGRLKLREFGDGTAQLIPYAKDYRCGPTHSEYALLPTDDPGRVKKLLSDLLGVEQVIEKSREVFLVDNCACISIASKGWARSSSSRPSTATTRPRPAPASPARWAS
jgi:adenylate cyclase class IV